MLKSNSLVILARLILGLAVADSCSIEGLNIDKLKDTVGSRRYSG